MKWTWQEFADYAIGYCRSFLIVVAMFMLSALIIGLVRTGWALPTNLFQVVMTLLVIALAVLAASVAVLSSDASVERVADAFSRHEVSYTTSGPCLALSYCAWTTLETKTEWLTSGTKSDCHTKWYDV